MNVFFQGTVVNNIFREIKADLSLFILLIDVFIQKQL